MTGRSTMNPSTNVHGEARTWYWCGNCRLVLTLAEAEAHARAYQWQHWPMALRRGRNARWEELRAEQAPIPPAVRAEPLAEHRP